jgi:hypothetical protein
MLFFLLLCGFDSLNHRLLRVGATQSGQKFFYETSKWSNAGPRFCLRNISIHAFQADDEVVRQNCGTRWSPLFLTNRLSMRLGRSTMPTVIR